MTQATLRFDEPTAEHVLCAAAGAVNDTIVTRAFADGRVRVELDEPVPALRITVHFVRPAGLGGTDSVRLVHVMSKPAGGEIRSYVIACGYLCLVGPARHGKWPEMDEAVAAATGAPVLAYVMSRANRSMPEAV